MSVSLINGHIDDDTPRMTDNEIIKAYGCCNLSHDECGGCDNCPCKIEGDCIVPSGFELEREVFNLLHRQKAEIERLKDTGLDIINQKRAEIETLKAEIKRLTKEKDKAWELFKKKCDEDIELQGLCDRHRIEIERLNTEGTEKTRALFQAMVNKFMSVKDLYVIVDGEYLPWEPAEEVEHLFGMSISGDNDECDKETDRVVKELVGDDK